MHTADPAAALRAVSLGVTGPRLAVIAALRRVPHADAQSIRRIVREGGGSISTQAVYDVTATLLRAGLVRRFEPAGFPARFELRTEDHHHVACRRCGAVADVERHDGTRTCLQPSQTHGHHIDEAEVTYWGLCPSCRSGSATAVRSHQ